MEPVPIPTTCVKTFHDCHWLGRVILQNFNTEKGNSVPKITMTQYRNGTQIKLDFENLYKF